MSETRQWVERFEALRDDLATGDLYHIQKWVQNDGALTEIAEEIARLTRELEAARELLRELAGGDEAGLAWARGWRCVYCGSQARYTVLHDRDCPIERARRALAKDTEVSDGE